jgi:hypothetical protein
MDPATLEFLVRNRFPRPIACACERVVLETTAAGAARAVRAAALTTLRFLSAVDLATRRARAEIGHLAVPRAALLRAGLPAGAFVVELAGSAEPVSRLLALAGEPGGGRPLVSDAGATFEALLEALQPLAPLARYRLIIPGPWAHALYRGTLVLLGAGLVYLGPELPGLDLPAGEPALADPGTGRFLGLSPLLRWEPGRSPVEGTLFLLTGLEGARGIFDSAERAVPRRLSLEPAGHSRERVLALDAAQVRALGQPASRLTDGETLAPHYAVRGTFYRGGTADLHRAVRLVDGAEVVLKTYEGGDDGENRRRFAREIRLGTRVAHPNVTPIVRARHVEADVAMEMAYVPGGNLADRLAVAGVLAPAEALAVMEGLGAALAAVHAAGYVHLDLKPENVLFTADGALRLIDLGIAEPMGGKVSRLGPGTQVGSEGFTPPERRARLPLDARADVWALGSLLHLLLTGLTAGAPDEVLGPRRLAPGLAAVIRSLVRPDPADRPASVEDALEQLRPAVARAPVPRAVALDLEGTILTAAGRAEPRPGLRDFADWCLDTFDRVFVYTAVEPGLALRILDDFTVAGHLPGAFTSRQELVDWPRGAGGSLKDLRRLRLPLPSVALLDDMAAWVPDDQRHRWVPILPYDVPRPGDRELDRAREQLLALLPGGEP